MKESFFEAHQKTRNASHLEKNTKTPWKKHIENTKTPWKKHIENTKTPWKHEKHIEKKNLKKHLENTKTPWKKHIENTKTPWKHEKHIEKKKLEKTPWKHENTLKKKPENTKNTLKKKNTKTPWKKNTKNTRNAPHLEKSADVSEVLIRAQKPPGKHGGEVLCDIVEVSYEPVLVRQEPPLGLQDRPHGSGEGLRRPTSIIHSVFLKKKHVPFFFKHVFF